MANRYWVGGTGTWGSTQTTNWSAATGLSFTASCTGTTLTTVGSPALVAGMTVYANNHTSLGTIVSGAVNTWVVTIGGTYGSQAMSAATVGASVPTAADNVFFDANSNSGTTAFTCTMANTPRVCNDFTASGLDGTMTLAGASIGLTVSGSLTFQATNFTRTYTGTTTFNATTTGKTVTTNGVAFGGAITFDGVGGEWTLGSAFTAGLTSNTALTNGTLDLQSYTLSTGGFNSTNSNSRTIAFGTGNITCTGTGNVWNTLTATNLTTTGTQVVNVTSAGSSAMQINAGALSEANSISYNFTGGTYALTFLSVGTHSARNIDFTGYAGTWNDTSGTNVFIYGNLKISSGMTLTAGTGTWTFGTTSGTKTITTNAKTLDRPIIFNGVGGTFQLQDALTMGSTRTATLINGTIDLFGKTLTVGTGFTTNAGTKNLTFNGGTLVCPDPNVNAFNNSSATNFTTTAGTGTGTISMTAATAKRFVGGGSTFNCTLNQGGAGDLTITGSNTFSNITNTVQPASILFVAGTTNTFSNFSLSGTAGNLITIGSTTAASHTLSKASGTVSVSFCSISQSSATGGATWQALTTNGNVNGGNNTGWDFGAVVYAAAIAETATAIDSPSVAASTFNAPVIETATVTDSPSVAASTFNAPVAETATATDAVLSFADFYAALSETITATDSVLSFADFYATLFETATATDSVISFADFSAALAETATATDAVLSFADFSAALSEATTATDSPLVAPSTFNAPVEETATATDAVSPPGSIYNAPVSETATISDLVLGAYLWNLIDDSQSVTWQNINSSPGTTWSPIDTDPDTGWSVIPTVN